MTRGATGLDFPGEHEDTAQRETWSQRTAARLRPNSGPVSGCKLKHGVGCGQTPGRAWEAVPLSWAGQDSQGLPFPCGRGQKWGPEVGASPAPPPGPGQLRRWLPWALPPGPEHAHGAVPSCQSTHRQGHPLLRAAARAHTGAGSACLCPPSEPPAPAGGRSPQFFSSEPSLQSFLPSHSGLVLLRQSPLPQR